MRSAQQRWYARTTSRMSSGSSRIESAVEPTMSQNRTVSWRRSAGDDLTTDDAGREPAGAIDGDVEEERLAPHLEQNLAPAETAWPQVGQERDRAAPHCSKQIAARRLNMFRAAKDRATNPRNSLSLLNNRQVATPFGRSKHAYLRHSAARFPRGFNWDRSHHLLRCFQDLATAKVTL
jgi:hypothetical protein